MTEPGTGTPYKDTKGNFDYRAFMAKYRGVTLTKFRADEIIYAQGDPAEAIFYIVSGSVKITVLSDQGKEGIIAMLGPDDFFGEGCLDGRRHRASTITTTTVSEIVRFSRDAIKRALADDVEFSQMFFHWILSRTEKLKADLIDQLFNSSEKRLARILLTLANTGPADASGVIATAITQETLAQMVGTTRARINQFMRKFSKLGYIEYNDTIRVRSSLYDIILSDAKSDPQ
jgi:CRP/FNR family cyclic AMP-dependent transcriptional regulator